jgi:hypothetical protein
MTIFGASEILTGQFRDKGGMAYNVMHPDFGATGNGTTDDTAAILAVIAAAPAGSTIEFPSGKTFRIGAEIVLSKSLRFVGPGATLKFTATPTLTGGTTLGMFEIQAADVEFSGLAFDATGVSAASLNNRFLWWTASVTNQRGTVRNCRFASLPGGGSNFNGAVGFGTGADDPQAVSCTFTDCPGAVFSQGARSRIALCTATAPKDVSFVLNSSNASGSIIGCKVYANNITCSIHIGIEQGVSNAIIALNEVHGVKDGIGIGCVSVGGNTTVGKNIVIATNLVDGKGYTATAAGALLKVGVFYEDVLIEGNRFINAPNGSVNTVAVIISARNSRFTKNLVRVGSAAATGLGAVQVDAGGGRLDIEDNVLDADGLSYALRFSSSDFTGQVVWSRRNRFENAVEGIHTTGATNLLFYEENEAGFVNCTSALNGTDWQGYFNSQSAWKLPHYLGERRVLYGNAAPTAGTWAAGDTVIQIAPGVAGESTVQQWRCSVAGSPGTWRAEGVRNATNPLTDADVTVTAGTDAESQRLNAPLTANRTVTLAGGWDGARFRFTRSSGGTGAFNWNIGGLKILAVSTWCTVVHDGTAWYLEAAGAL